METEDVAGGRSALPELVPQVQQGSKGHTRPERKEEPNSQHHEEIQSVLHGLSSSRHQVVWSHGQPARSDR